MGDKVKLAIFDGTLKIQIKKYPISESGKQIKVVSGGENHFMPQFDNYSYLEFPKKFLFWTIGHERIYFVQKGAKKCIDFKTGTVSGPDLEQLKQSIGAVLLDKLGHEEPPIPAWIIYLILITVLGIAAKVFGVIV